MKVVGVSHQRGFFLSDWLYDGFCMKNVFRFGLLFLLIFAAIKIAPVYRDAYKASQVLKRVQQTADPFAANADIKAAVKAQLKVAGVASVDVDQALTVLGRGEKRVLTLDYVHEAKLTEMVRLVFEFVYSNNSEWGEVLLGAPASP